MLVVLVMQILLMVIMLLMAELLMIIYIGVAGKILGAMVLILILGMDLTIDTKILDHIVLLLLISLV